MKKNLFSRIVFILFFAFCIFGTVSETAKAYTAPQELQINLNSDWELAYFDMNSTQWIAEYGLKGEDVIHFKWTKLVTVNGLNNMPPAVTTDYYTQQFKILLQNQAKQMGRELYYNTLPSPAGEKWFEWSISGRGETEICRVIKIKNTIYHMHYAEKKSQFSQAERNNIISILKRIKINN